MPTLIVVRNPKDWPIHIPGIEIVSSRDYLSNARYAEMPHAKVFNLCRSYDYQSNGYYVSLLAEARAHKPLPDISALQNMRLVKISRIMTEDVEKIIQSNLRDIQGKEFTLSIYFGKNVAKKYDRLSWKLFNLFEAPLLRAYFVHKKEWELKRITPISTNEIPEHHMPFVVERAQAYFARKRVRPSKRSRHSYDLAILVDPEEKIKPSNKRAMQRFMRAAQHAGMRPELITREDYGWIAEFDALFIRTTTRVNDYTFQFARRAEAEGLAVIDDSESIIRCGNKVYLAEAARIYGIPVPKTWIVQREQLEELRDQITFPCVLKLPDSSFSLNVVKSGNWEELSTEAAKFFESSEMIVLQEFVPTQFDWRIGVLDGKPLFACLYHMVRHHWQIVKKASTGRTLTGKVIAVPLKDVPAGVLDAALSAARVMGQGLYGVDVKQADDKIFVMEVNDNPNIDARYEDAILKMRLYIKIMRSLRRRIEAIKAGKGLQA